MPAEATHIAAADDSHEAETWLGQYLAYAPHFTLYAQGEDRLLLISEERSFRLNGAIYRTLIPLLDGHLRGQEVIDRLASIEPPAELRSRLGRLLANGYATIVAPGVDMRRQAYWSALGEVPAVVIDRLRRTRLAVVPFGETQISNQRAAKSLAAGFADLGFTVSPEAEADLTLVLLDDYLQPAARDFAQAAHRAGRRWVPFKPGGNTTLLGPLIGGPDGHCFLCLGRRMIEHRATDRIIAPPTGGVRPAKSWLPHTVSAAVGLAGVELARLARGVDSALKRGLLAWNPEQGQSTPHAPPRFGDCPVCGAVRPRDVREATPIRPSRGGAAVSTENGWRSLAPDEVLRRLEACVSPLTGIIDGVTSTELAPGVHVCSAQQASRAAIDPRLNRQLGRPEGAAGKGFTAEQARISCLAEAIERYAAGWTATEPQRIARWRELGRSAPHPDLLLGFSDHQYANRERLNETASVTERIPLRFDDKAAIAWSPAWSLRDDAERWLPARFVYYNYDGTGVDEDHAFCMADSNGTASGATLEEALFQAALELVERDGVAMWWYNRLQMPEIALDGIDDRLVEPLVKHYRSIGRDMRLIDLTNDLGIPVVAAISVTADGKRPLLGLGAHLDPRIAALRALSEINQMLAGIEKVSDDDRSRLDPTGMIGSGLIFVEGATVEKEPYMAPRPGTPRAIDDLPASYKDGTIGGGLRHLVDRFAAMGHDTIALDYGRNDLPLVCARIVVPGLRHFWSRRAPGRLYDVPVRMGWLDEPRAEAELNPVGFFF